MKASHCWHHLLVVGAALAVAGAQADSNVSRENTALFIILNVERFNDYSLTFDDLKFTNARAFHVIEREHHALLPLSFRLEEWELPQGHANFDWAGADGISVFFDPPGQTSVNGKLFSLLGHDGFSTISYDFGPEGKYLTIENIGGRKALRYKAESAGGVDILFPYTWQMTTPGDWSASGTQTGQHELVNIEPSWDLQEDFTYDAITDTTTVRAYREFYNPLKNINIEFILYGEEAGKNAYFYRKVPQNVYEEWTVYENAMQLPVFRVVKPSTFTDIVAGGDHYAHTKFIHDAVIDYTVYQNGKLFNAFSIPSTADLELYGWEGGDAYFTKTIKQGVWTEWFVWKNGAPINSFMVNSTYRFQALESGDVYHTTKTLPGNQTQEWTIYRNGAQVEQFAQSLQADFARFQHGDVYFTHVYTDGPFKFWTVWRNDQQIQHFKIADWTEFFELCDGDVYHRFVEPQGAFIQWSIWRNGKLEQQFAVPDGLIFHGLR